MNDELTCAEIEELLPGYATHALVEEERCSFLAHLAECRRHDDEMAAYRAVTARLPDVIESVEPPSHVRSSLLSNFDALVAAPTDEPQGMARPRMRWLRVVQAPAFAYGLAAAFMVIAVGLAVAAFSDGGDDLTQVAVSQNGRQLKVTYLQDQQLALLETDMPALPSSRTYQAWQIVDGKPVSLGVVGQGGRGVTAFEADLDAASAVALSIEPAGGSATPTEVVLAVEL